MPSERGPYRAKMERNIYLPDLLLDKGVPRTNQSIVYYPGDDGTFQAGVEKILMRFVDNNDGTISDKATNLMWVADPSMCGIVFGSPGFPYTMTWEEAVANCLCLDYAGYKDWRLPNSKELESLVDYSKVESSIDETKFKNIQKAIYHSSSVTNYGCDNQYLIHFQTGVKTWGQDKTKQRFAIPVRSIPSGHRSKIRGRGK